ncbi:MAG: SphA family protein [Magnetospiraceae bacterium]
MLAVSGPALAKDGGDQYNHGAEGFMSGALPPPGTYFLGYATHYWGDLVDNDGDEVPAPGGNISVNVDAVALRIVHMTDKKIFGANYGVHAILPILSVDIDIDGVASDSDTGIGDIVFDPLILAWHRPNLHYVAALDFVAPTGSWEATEIANVGANYWSIEPLFAITYLSDSGFEVSSKFMYNYKFENPDNNIRSGDEFHLDYTVAQHWNNWTFGVGGYWVEQLENDEFNGTEIANSKRRSLSVGPQINYNYQGISFIAKWQHEVLARNTFKGDRLHAKVILAF